MKRGSLHQSGSTGPWPFLVYGGLVKDSFISGLQTVDGTLRGRAMDEAGGAGALRGMGVGYEELRQAVRTEQGMLAVLQAVTAGEPATKRVLALLVARFGERLTADSASQLNAGLAVAELLRECGFREDRRAGSASGGSDLRWRVPVPAPTPVLRRVY